MAFRETGWLVPVGRTVMVFGGAFLLRALTEAGTLSVAAGVWLGLAYAGIWLGLALRTGGLGSQLHGLSTVLIAVPLIVEAALRFRYFPVGASAAVLAASTLATLAVASARYSRFLAGLAATGAIVAAWVLAFGFGAFVPFALVVLLVALASLLAAYQHGWRWLAWPGALAANLLAALLTLRAVAQPPREDPVQALAVNAALIASYLGAIVIRTALHDRPILFFEVVQTASVFVIGVAGSVAIAHTHGLSLALIAIPAMLAGAGLYVQTFTRIVPRFGLGTEFFYFGMTALAFSLVGLSLSFPFPARPVIVALAALLAIIVGWRWNQPMLALQGGIAAVVAAGQCGLIAFAARAWLTSAPVWPSHPLPMGFVLATVAAALLIPRVVRAEKADVLEAIERVALSIALAAGLASLAVAVLAPIVAGSPPDSGVLATLRTGVVAILAVLLAWVGKSSRFVEMRWLAFAALAGGAVKILADDLPASRPATLFIALAVYGASLIAVPKIVKARARSVS